MSYPAPKLPWWVVAKREILAKVTDKGFWISTLSVLVIMGISFALSFFFASGNDKMKVAVADEASTQVVQLAARMSGKEITPEQVPAAEFEKAVDEDRVKVALSHGDGGWQMTVKSLDTNVADIQKAIETYTTAENAKGLGINPADLTKGTQVDIKLAGEQQTEQAGAAMIAGFVFSILFMMSSMTYGVQIAQSVAEEKESRLVEILTSAVSVRDLLTGKVIGNTIMALGQLVLFVVAGVVALSFTPWGHLLPMLAPGIGWFLVFFLAGFIALASLWAAAGAMASRVQDTSNTTTPLIMIIMMVYMAGFMARGAIAKVLSFVPVVSTVVMPQRVLTGESTWWEALIALAICIAFILLTVRIGAAIYRRGLRKTGGVMKLKEIFAKQEV